ncbi:MAG: TolC family protein [Burkholderiales bacterium]|nr:TolC family protein [Burkholderiales bacterium]
MKPWIAAASFLLAAPLFASDLASPGDLPSAEQVHIAVEQDPAVNQARHGVQASTHSAAMLAASPYEWIAGTTAQRRRIDGAGTSDEWNLRLERTVRIGGKADLDRDLGNIGSQIAKAQLSAARNETARQLLDLWLDWLTARQTKALLGEQVQFAESNAAVVDKRRKAGDASMLDLNVAKGDLAEVQRLSSMAASNEAKAQATLRIRFPNLPLEPRSLSEPLPLERDETQWRALIQNNSDMLQVAQLALKKAELTAERLRKDRLPDPTVGVFTASEGAGTERIVGLSLSIPLGGTYRTQSAMEALQQVEVARAGTERQIRDLDVQIATLIGDATSSYESWHSAEQSAGTARDTARLTHRAFSLGEADLQTLILVRRQSVDAANAAVVARTDALRARYRLLIQAGLLWALAQKPLPEN